MSAIFNLIRYDAACTALSEAKAVDEAKEIRDVAEAMRAYAHQAKNKQLEIDAAEIRIRAERRIGELMKAQKDAGQMATGTQGQLNGKDASGGFVVNPPEKPITLAEAGIDKNLANRARKLAAVPEEEFQQEMEEWRDRVSGENERVTTRLETRGDEELQKEDKEEAKECNIPDGAIVDVYFICPKCGNEFRSNLVSGCPNCAQDGQNGTERKILGKGVFLANEAINSLSRIPTNDALRMRGFQIVMDWIKKNIGVAREEVHS